MSENYQNKGDNINKSIFKNEMVRQISINTCIGHTFDYKDALLIIPGFIGILVKKSEE